MPIPSQPLIPPKRRKPRKGRVFPPPVRSARLYVYLEPSRVRLFKYLLEARDNLAIMTVADRWRAALCIRFSPHQERETREWLEGMRSAVPFDGPFAVAGENAGAETRGAPGGRALGRANEPDTGPGRP